MKIGMVSALSLTLAACSSKTTTAWCVDRQAIPAGNVKGGYKVVSDFYCERTYSYTSPDYGRYFWYYGGKRTSDSGSGSTYVSGGSHYAPSKGKIKSSSGKTLRGGFGGSGRSGS
ncbi:hypothetical protein ABZ801_08450 [Actinomadura sp. NPDC047616]|uniref:hypothetical protein n=1 Tax=Actinomadura sp. NPDC047616 TaxID=3155914 RepID=UPI0033DA1CEA